MTGGDGPTLGWRPGPREQLAVIGRPGAGGPVGGGAAEEDRAARPVPVLLEVLHLERPDTDGPVVSARRRLVAAPDGFVASDPNAAAGIAAGIGTAGGLAAGDATWVHSTSWRVDGQAVVLTFLAFGAGDSRTEGWERLEPVDPAVRPGAAEEVTLLRVLHHGVRHLAFLAGRDPALRSTVIASGLERVLVADPALAGVLSERPELTDEPS